MEKIKHRFHLTSIRSGMVCYVGAALLAGLVLNFVTVAAIDNIMLNLMNPRPDALVFISGRNISIVFGDSSVSSEITNQSLFDFLKFIRTIFPALIYTLCITTAVFLFYVRKIQKPLKALNSGIAKISRQELDFSIECNCSNELGKLCDAFEHMRQELVHAFHALWKSEENQRSLYRAFAHDLRTPLSVIKGCNENILHVAVKNNDWPLVQQSVSLSDNAAARIETYAEQLKELESIDDYQPNLNESDLSRLADSIRQQMTVLSKKEGKEILFTANLKGTAKIDTALVMRILDNLVDNALRYAKSKVNLEIFLYDSLDDNGSNDKRITFTVTDDGPGFSAEALKQAANPFYTTERSSGHTGIGLTVSQELLHLCGGRLSLKNISQGGAQVTFYFLI